ncbi:MAG: LysR family transcriptional regulator [Sphingomonadales bacterium]|nr:LysR family transcriptional regulator [Sphingomonadales bacterium]
MTPQDTRPGTELRRLRYFLAVAEELHFGRAATRLDIAQPPLSRQIAALEAELGVDLFDRSRSQIRLTQAGQVLQAHATALLERLETAWRETRLVGTGAGGGLRIGFAGSAAHGPLPDLIRAFRAQYPAVTLSLGAMAAADLHSALIRREIDIAIARPALTDEEFRRETLSREDLILALPETDPLAAAERVRFADLRGRSFVLYPAAPRPGHADTVLEICAREGVRPAATEVAPDCQSAIHLVAVGVGVAVVPASVARSARPGVAFRPYAGHNPGTGLSVHARRDNRAPQVMNFLDSVRRFVRAADPGPAGRAAADCAVGG